jgi:SAM-dependent methyltransferase
VTALEAVFYDEAMTAEGSLAMAPLEKSPWLDVYEAAALFLNPLFPVIDLGCGTGRFAELLRLRGHPSYHGFDFAPDVVREAASYCATDGYSFTVADIREWEHGPTLPDECSYVLLEVLEHLDDDLDALERVPPGQPVVFSVPNFWSRSHVRRFLQPRDVFDRYGSLLDFTAWQSLAYPIPGRRIHLFKATRRAGCL